MVNVHFVTYCVDNTAPKRRGRTSHSGKKNERLKTAENKPNSPSIPSTEQRRPKPRPFPGPRIQLLSATTPREYVLPRRAKGAGGTSHTENMQEPSSSKTVSKMTEEKLRNGGSGGDGGGGRGDGGTQTSKQKNKKTAVTKKTETKGSSTDAQPDDKNSAENDRKRGDKEAESDSKENNAKNEGKHAQSDTKPKNPKPNDRKQNDRGNPEKRREDKKKTSEKESSGDSKSKGEGKDANQQAGFKVSGKGKTADQTDSKTKREGEDTKQADPETRKETNDLGQADSKTKREGKDAEATGTKISKKGSGTKHSDVKTKREEKDTKQTGSKTQNEGRDAKHADAKTKSEEKNISPVDAKTKKGEKDAAQTDANAARSGKDAKQADIKASDKGKHGKQADTKGKDGKHVGSKTVKEGKGAKQTRGKNDGNSAQHTELNVTEETDNSHHTPQTETEQAQESNSADSAEKKDGNAEEPASCSKTQTKGKKKSLDEDSLQMFLSTDDFPDRAGDGGWMVPDQYSDETKRRQEEIIRRILEEFDLEETMRKYRNSNAQSYRPTGTGLQDYQFRSELLRLMGTEEIRLNDQEWNTRFKEKLTEDYERLLDRQEENLAYAETRRMHRLRVEGILPEARKEDDDLGSYFNLRLSQMALEAAPSSSTSTKKKQGKRGGPASSTSDWESKAIFTKDESNQREKTMRTRRHEKVYHPSEDVQTQVAKEKQTITEEDEELEGSSMDDADALVQTAVKDELEEAKESIERHRQKRLDRMPPNIRRLYEEETISGLYKIAQDLVLAESNARNPPRKGVKPE